MEIARISLGIEALQVFSFWKIFVGAYYEDDEGNYQYVGYDIVENPQPSGNPYNIDIELIQPEDIRFWCS